MNVIEKIQAKLAAGMLPLDPPAKLLVGKGNAFRCDACDFPVTDLETQFDAADGHTWRFHRACYNVWTVALTTLTRTM
jgi:hypothetical protein